MQYGKHDVAILLKKNKSTSGIKFLSSLEGIVDDSGWIVSGSSRSSIDFYKDLPKPLDHYISGSCFRLSGKDGYNHEMLHAIVPEEKTKDYDYGIIFDSDGIGHIASCYISMINRHKHQLANALKKKYGSDKVAVIKSFPLDSEKNIDF
ncbi:MAG: hypothetical protein ACLFPQ_01855 [Candidatus Woesearchaeota archaeon]